MKPLSKAKIRKIPALFYALKCDGDFGHQWEEWGSGFRCHYCGAGLAEFPKELTAPMFTDASILPEIESPLRLNKIAIIPVMYANRRCSGGGAHNWMEWKSGFQCSICRIGSVCFPAMHQIRLTEAEMNAMPVDKITSPCSCATGHLFKKSGSFIYCDFCEESHQIIHAPKAQIIHPPKEKKLKKSYPKRAKPSKMEIKRRRSIREIAWEETGGRCVYCDQFIQSSQRTLDHILPDSMGGPYEEENLMAACRDCNGARSSHYPPSEKAHPNWKKYVEMREFNAPRPGEVIIHRPESKGVVSMLRQWQKQRELAG